MLPRSIWASLWERERPVTFHGPRHEYEVRSHELANSGRVLANYWIQVRMEDVITSHHDAWTFEDVMRRGTVNVGSQA